MEQDFLKRIVESLIFASDSPLSIDQICGCIDDVTIDEVSEALTQLKTEYSNPSRSFFIKRTGGGFQFATKPGSHR